MTKATLVLLSFSSACIVVNKTTATINTGDNRQEYVVSCKFLTIAESPFDLPQPSSLSSDEYELIQALNLSTSTDKWQNMMYEDKTPKSVHADAKAAGKDKPGYDNCWSDWQKAALDVLEDGGPQDVKELKVGALTQEQKAAAHAFISKIANKARRIKSTFPQLSAAALERTQAKASKTLKMAVYGADVSERRAETSNAAFGEDTQNTARETVCEAADGNKRAKTVLATLTCLCEKPDSTEVTDGACTKEAEGTTGW
uniref:Variant surface glycoprotein 1897 n=1 Tax=Trypanosoma brucei TaxID=5691 RepID=M4SWL8_9TRYP|nr:variant surface glycoprotein 1897 [Trypanosoma brucei]